ncbi:ubiquinol oxidase subunit II [Dyella sp. A6]|uniref:ubiquinol oxidase subunit II n=1 Tax=Dyella aluminiiresistens TaxID=3069105 RepID=UPI002E7761DC|nr:ubiquinol oxidase subunit II [Dyella sp. A6]
MARSTKTVVFPALIASLLSGCHSGVLDPQGPVGASEKLILIDSLVIMLAIVVPTILATLVFAWWYRAGNKKAHYRPNWAFSGHLELIVWAIPALVIIFLGGIAWFGSKDLDPYKALPSTQKPVEVQVVSLDWKWLFIYPDQHIASVNRLVIPVGRPVHFDLTSTGVMNSFFVPQLGSQIYTMARMVSQLNLQADHAGDYHGLSAQFSGAGFSDMDFQVQAVSPDDYAKWLATAQASGTALDHAAYRQFRVQSSHVPPMTYREVAPQLFQDIVNERFGPAQGPQGGVGGHDLPLTEKGS